MKTNIVNRPQTIDELLRLSGDELARCDIARMNLLCATGLPGAESLGVDELLDRLDAWAERIFGMTESHRDSFHRHPALFENSEPLWRMLGLTRILEQEYHIHYHPDCIDREPDWGDSTTLLLHGLLGSQRHGTCPSLPVLVVAVGRRLSYPLHLVAAPGHLFCRRDGDHHVRAPWRETWNIEFRGDGMNVHPDEFYLVAVGTALSGGPVRSKHSALSKSRPIVDVALRWNNESRTSSAAGKFDAESAEGRSREFHRVSVSEADRDRLFRQG